MDQYKELTYEDAKRLANRNGYQDVRITVVDKFGFAVHSDYRTGRINFKIKTPQDFKNGNNYIQRYPEILETAKRNGIVVEASIG